jgi:hypothetical protein
MLGICFLILMVVGYFKEALYPFIKAFYEAEKEI